MGKFKKIDWIQERIDRHNEKIKKKDDKETINKLFLRNKEYFFKIVDRYRHQQEYQKEYRLKKKLELANGT